MMISNDDIGEEMVNLLHNEEITDMIVALL